MTSSDNTDPNVPDQRPPEDQRAPNPYAPKPSAELQHPPATAKLATLAASDGAEGNADDLANDLAETAAASQTQWQLIVKRFSKHRLAVWSLYVLIVLYMVSGFCEFFAPYTGQWKDLTHPYSPPQTPAWSISEGWTTPAIKLEMNPITFEKAYEFVDGVDVPLGFFVKGEPYEMFGLIPMERRFFGVDLDEWHQKYPAGSGVDVTPTLYLLGSDRYGRDLLSRIIYGGRISLSVGLLGIAITFFLGLLIGGISGYVGGLTDNLIQRFIEILGSIPSLPLLMVIAATLPPDWSSLYVYLGITVILSFIGWTGLARVTRGKILSLREEDYVVAARLLGASNNRILWIHLIPGFTSHIIVSLTLALPAMILGETGLSFLGLGLRPPIVSWGVLLQDCMNIEALTSYPWLMLPVLPIILTVMAFNFLGDGLRDAADPYAGK